MNWLPTDYGVFEISDAEFLEAGIRWTQTADPGVELATPGLNFQILRDLVILYMEGRA